MDADDSGRWLLLLHQLPPKPTYFRVKIWRRLQRLGAVAIKNSVYVLPRSEQGREDFEWVLREIVKGGGDASLCEARFVEGLTDEQVAALFHAARDADYAQIAEEARRVAATVPAPRTLSAEHRTRLAADLTRLRRRLADVSAIDWLGAPGREAADGLVSALEAALTQPGERSVATASLERGEFRGRTWVTRKDVHIDRMASAWLIRRFIDPEARVAFVAHKGYRPRAGEVRFDMFEAEFSHDGDRCTFEVLLTRFGLRDPALTAVAEMVHDVDFKDGKFAREETLGIERLVAGIAMAQRDDEARLVRSAAVLDDLYEYFTRTLGKKQVHP